MTPLLQILWTARPVQGSAGSLAALRSLQLYKDYDLLFGAHFGGFFIGHKG